MTVSRQPLIAPPAEDGHLRLALEAGGLGTWEWTIAEGRVRWSESLERIHGLEAGTFTGTFEAFLSDVHPDDRELVQDSVQRALNEGSHEVEYRIVLPDETTRWVLGKGTVLRSPSGEPERMLGVCTDISARKAAEEALRQSEHLYRELIADLGVAVYTTDASGRVMLFNEAAAELWGRRPDLGVDLWCGSWRLYYADGRPMPLDECPLARTLKTGEAVRGEEIVAEQPNGARVWIQPYPSLLYDHAGRLTGAVNVLVDITDRKRAEQRQLFLTEASTMLASSLDLDIVLGQLADLVIGNMADWCAIDLLSEDASEAEETIQRVALAHSDPANDSVASRLRQYVHTVRSAQTVLDALSSGEGLLFEHLDRAQLEGAAMNEDHLNIMVEQGFHSAMIVPLHGRGRLLGGITFIRAETAGPYTSDDLALAEDLARRAAFSIDNARLFRQGQETQERLAKANAAKDEFLGLISHELRTPITTIYGGSRLLSARWSQLDEDARTSVMQGIEQETERLHHLVEDLLALSRLEFDRRADVEPILVRRIIDKVAEAFQRRGHAIEVDLPEDIYTVAGNQGWVEQVLRNLIGNAIKYGASNGHAVVVRMEPHDREHVVVRVLDRGPGIEQDDTERIFESFYRSPEFAKRVSGAGIGLTVCKRLVEAQSGQIWARRRAGGGLEVSFTLPLFKEDSA